MHDEHDHIPPLPPAHRDALRWFADHTGDVVSYATLVEHQLMTRAKGIYKPAGSPYALSIRQGLGSPYADSDATASADGGWTMQYAQEGSTSLDDRERLYTNRGLMACLRDEVPVGVLVQRSPKPTVQYRVLGLAMVTDWHDGFFTLSSHTPDSTDPVQPPTSASTAQPDARGPRYWAFLATPKTYDIERAVQEVEFDTWTTQHYDVRPGDRALIWKAKWSTSTRGLVAFAEVLTAPATIPPGQTAYWRTADRLVAMTRVWIKYRRLDRLPLWLDGANPPALAALAVSRARGGSVFRVTPEQWAAVLEAAGGWPADASPLAELAQEAVHLAESGAFDPTLLEDARQRRMREVALRQGQPAFRAQLLAAYEGRCAISGCAVAEVLEAAHIVPYQGEATNHVTNGLLLRSDLHTLFDLGLLAIDEDSRQVVLAPQVQHGEYAPFQGIRLRSTVSEETDPSRAALRWHRERAGLGRN